MGGRGGSSGMGGGLVGRAKTAMDEYRAALADANAVGKTKEQQDRINAALTKTGELHNEILASVSDTALKKGADGFLDGLWGTESDRNIQMVMNRLSATKKDGTPTSSAMQYASAFAGQFIVSRSNPVYAKVGGSLPIKSTEVSSSNINRVATAIAKSAQRYRKTT